LKEDVMDEEIL